MINKELLIETIDFLKEKNISIGAVESFSGGLFSSTYTSIPGVSKIFLGSIVSYSSLIKENVLNINKDIIDKYTVVSKEVAYEMAFQGHKVLGADLVVSFTGNAGPTADKGGKPVGLFYIGIYYKDEVQVFEFQLNLERNELRNEAINLANEKIFEILGKNFKNTPLI